MKMYLYYVDEPDNKVLKTLTDPYEIDINLKSETDVTSPDILLSSAMGVNYLDYNYCYIPDLGRYYFINSVNSVNSRLWRLSCECDVLMTYKDDILASNARLWRSIKNGDYFNAVIDSKIIKSVAIYESDVTMPDGETLILTTVGV